MLSSWYPNSLYESEGDFVRFQSEMMHYHGLDISVFHVSMSIRYLVKGLFARRENEGDSELSEYLVEKPFWPRNNSFGIERWANGYYEEVKRHCEKHGWPDIIWAHTYLGGQVASLIKENKQIPYVLTLHESFIVEESVPTYHIPYLIGALEKANQIVAVGDQLKYTLAEYTTRHVHVLPNFIDFDHFKISKKKYDLFTFIFVGELIPRKQVDQLLNVFDNVHQEYPNTQLLIIGDGPESKNLMELKDSLLARSAIHFKGRMPQETVAKTMSMAHCLVLPSQTETFGIVLAEAMAVGIPFISTDSGVPKSHFNHKACRFTPIHYLFQNMKDCIESMGDVSPLDIRGFAKNVFSSEVVITQYIDLFNKVISNK